jgi:hypothetical protein
MGREVPPYIRKPTLKYLPQLRNVNVELLVRLARDPPGFTFMSRRKVYLTDALTDLKALLSTYLSFVTIKSDLVLDRDHITSQADPHYSTILGNLESFKGFGAIAKSNPNTSGFNTSPRMGISHSNIHFGVCQIDDASASGQ